MAVLGSLSGPLAAQLPASRLLTLFPPGGRQGTSFEATLGGADLDEAEKLVFSHPGITAAPKLQAPGPFQTQPRPVPGQFVVTVAADVPEGIYEARAAGRFGFSNSRLFAVGSQEEVGEKEPNNNGTEAQRLDLETTLNASIGGGADVDCYRFNAAAGMRVVVDCWAYRLDSQLGAVLILEDAAGAELDRSRPGDRSDPALDFTAPADGDYVVRVLDLTYRGGGEFFYRLSIGTSPRVDAILPPAGLAGTKGRFVLLGRNLPGSQPAPDLLVDGKPLDRLEVEIQLPWEPAFREFIPGELVEGPEALVDGTTYQLRTPQGTSNPVFLSFAAAPVVREREPNNVPKEAQTVAAPCEVAGQFYPREDEDWIQFEARRGDIWWIEVFSHRLGLQTDPFLVIQQVTRDAQGNETVKELAVADDLGGNLGGANFNTGTEDAAYRLAAPEDGLYRVLLKDLYSTSLADPRHVYRLAIRPEQPDFRLVAVPRFRGEDPKKLNVWSLLLRRGGTEVIDVLVSRRDGFDGEVNLTASQLPPGVACAGAIVSRGGSSATLVFEAAEDAPDSSGFVDVVGRASIGGADVARRARSGALVWPGEENALAPRSRLGSGLALAVRGAETAPFLVAAGDGKVQETARGGKLEIPVKLTRRGDFKGDVTLTAAGLPPNIEAKNVTIKGDASAGTLELTVKNEAPLTTATFHLVSQAEVSYSRNPQAAERAAAWKQEIDKIAAEVKAASDKATSDKAEVEKAAAEKAALARKAAEAHGAAVKAAAEAAQVAKAAKEKKEAAQAALDKSPEDIGLQGAKAQADKEMEAAATNAKGIEDGLTTAQKAMEASAQEEKAATELKAAAEKAAAELAEKLKAAAAEQTDAQKRAEEAAKAAKPANVKVFFPSTPITLRIVGAPLELALGTAGGLVVQGGKLELPFRLERRHGFAEAVNVAVALPDSLKGVTAAAVAVPKEQADAKLVFEAAPDASPGRHAVTVKATVKFAGQDREVAREFLLRVARPPKP